MIGARINVEAYNRLVEIANALGKGWEVVDMASHPTHNTDIEVSDGDIRMRLKLTPKNRLKVMLLRPPFGERHYSETVEIGIRFTRKVEVIAKDIHRRFMPDAREQAKNDKAAQHETKEREAKKEANKERLIALGATRQDWRPDGMYFPSHGREWSINNLNVRHDAVDMELRYLSPELAEKVIKVLLEG